MGMGSFKQKVYKSFGSPGDYTSSMVQLLKNQGEGFDKIVNAVDDYGEGRARGKVSDLMGSGHLQGKTPEEVQAMIQQVTGGRDVGEAGRKTIDNYLSSARDTQGNEWKENAATTLFGRQNTQIAQRFANSQSLQGSALANSRALAEYKNTLGEGRDAKKAKLEGVSGLLSGKQLGEIGAKIETLTDAIENGELDEAAKMGAKKRLTELKTQYVRGAAEKPSSAAVGYATGINKDGTRSTGTQSMPQTAKPVNVPIAKELKMVLPQGKTLNLQRGLNAGTLFQQNVNEGKKGKDGKRLKPKYIVVDARGNEVDSNSFSKYIK